MLANRKLPAAPEARGSGVEERTEEEKEESKTEGGGRKGRQEGLPGWNGRGRTIKEPAPPVRPRFDQGFYICKVLGPIFTLYTNRKRLQQRKQGKTSLKKMSGSRELSLFLKS